jgi:hypothetical protein
MAALGCPVSDSAPALTDLGQTPARVRQGRSEDSALSALFRRELDELPPRAVDGGGLGNNDVPDGPRIR